MIGCKSVDTNQCTPTFLGNWPTILQKYINIQYVCNDCHQNTTLNKEDILVNRLALMEENMNIMVTKINKIEQAVTNPVQPAPTSTAPVTKPSYADKLKPAIIVIEKKVGEENPEVHTQNMNKIKVAAVESAAAVLKTYRNGVGDTVLVCRNEASKQKLLPRVNEVFKENKVSTPQSRLPTITILDIASNLNKDELFKTIKEQNKDIGINLTEDNFNILFVKNIKSHNQYPDTYQAVVRVSEDVRDVLEAPHNRICIELQSCKVVDRLFVRRCNKCQDFKHFHRECKSDVNVCGKCGENHDTRICQSPTVKCINCSKNEYDDTAHETSWRKCPSYLKEQQKLRKTIPYYDQKNI